MSRPSSMFVTRKIKQKLLLKFSEFFLFHPLLLNCLFHNWFVILERIMFPFATLVDQPRSIAPAKIKIPNSCRLTFYPKISSTVHIFLCVYHSVLGWSSSGGGCLVVFRYLVGGGWWDRVELVVFSRRWGGQARPEH